MIGAQSSQGVVQDFERSIARPVGCFGSEKNILPALAQVGAEIIQATSVSGSAVEIVHANFERVLDYFLRICLLSKSPQHAFAAQREQRYLAPGFPENPRWQLFRHRGNPASAFTSSSCLTCRSQCKPRKSSH